MVDGVKLVNVSAEQHSEWEVKCLVSMAFHMKVGGTGALFHFRKKGSHAVFEFIFVGLGLGVGLGGVSSANFVPPHKLAKDTAVLVGAAFLEAGMSLLGKNSKPAQIPDWEKDITAWTPLQCSSAFSAADLDRAMGRCTMAGAGLAAGYGQTIITAFKFGQNMFESQSLSSMDVPLVGGMAGGAVAVGATASTNVGIWLKFKA